MAVFEASFEGTGFNSETFDVKFFMDNATEVVKEVEVAAATTNKQ